jgi:DNA-nicking Smr family endonuclease
MKKKKTHNQPTPDFKNDPFGALKKFAPRPYSAGTKPPPPHAEHAKNREDDSAFFLRAVEGVRRIDGAVKVGEAPRRQKGAKKQGAAAGAPEDEALFLQAMQKIGTTFRNENQKSDVEEPALRSSSSRMRQLKRGTIRISRELDLHGFQKAEALVRLAQFVASAFSQGQTAVLVITGKGINSPEGPVLPGAVATWLQEKGRGMVAEFSPAPRTLGGSGAFVVFLKKRRV